MKLTAAQLAQELEAELVGDETISFNEVSPLKTAGSESISFLSSNKYLPDLERSKAGGVIVSQVFENIDKPQLVVNNVDVALIKTLEIFSPSLKRIEAGIDRSAVVSSSATVAESAYIGACAVLEDNVRIGKNTVISSGCKIGENTVVGDNSRFDSNVVIYHNCSIGNHVIIMSNTVIGATGFGYSLIDGVHRLVPHNGGVIIEDYVEIGANTCIDRAKFDNTIVGAGTKIDDMVMIAHNVVMGKCCLIVAQVGIAGSAKLGNGVVLSGRSGVKDNVEIGDGVIVGLQSVVMSDIEAGKKLFGTPAIDFKEEAKLIILRKRLPKMAAQLKELRRRIEKLEASENDNK